MKLCHAEEHTSCFQYGADSPAIEIVEMKGGEERDVSSDSNEIFFVIKGMFNISSKKTQNKKIKTGESVLIPSHSPCVITAAEEVHLLVIRLDFNISFCNQLPLESVLEVRGKAKKETDIGTLDPNQRLLNFANTMRAYIEDGLKCSFFFDIKIREFLFLIRACYDKQVIYNFFRPVYNTDFVFTNNIYKNLDSVKTIKELAGKLDYSLSGFEKKFKRIFHSSPYHWMQEQRAKKIYHEIHCSKKTFTEIAFEHDFSSPAHFNVFCKIFFGKTPGELRKENMKRTASLFN